MIVLPLSLAVAGQCRRLSFFHGFGHYIRRYKPTRGIRLWRAMNNTSCVNNQPLLLLLLLRAYSWSQAKHVEFLCRICNAGTAFYIKLTLRAGHAEGKKREERAIFVKKTNGPVSHCGFVRRVRWRYGGKSWILLDSMVRWFENRVLISLPDESTSTC